METAIIVLIPFFIMSLGFVPVNGEEAILTSSHFAHYVPCYCVSSLLDAHSVVFPPLFSRRICLTRLSMELVAAICFFPEISFDGFCPRSRLFTPPSYLSPHSALLCYLPYHAYIHAFETAIDVVSINSAATSPGIVKGPGLRFATSTIETINVESQEGPARSD